ncbi:MAG: cobaltochelatase subunit CobN, partial [Methanophagales archaeon]|nr:cobaltochelatase subunit CobN [Methanophagales archaeon]
IMESEIFHLLGVKPVWDKRKTVKGVKLVPASELGRPRIDVIITTTGVYRDNWPDKIMLIDKAVHLAAEANDTPNYVRENSELIYAWLRTHTNYTEAEAHNLSMLRVFAPPDGKWGTGLTHATIRSSTWENESTLADLYIGTMSHVYGENIWGEQLQDLFRQNLNGTEIAIFSRSSNVLGILDTDHPYEFLGGLGLAVRSVTGETPTMYINNLRDPNRPTTETLSQFLSRELRTRYFNPHYIEGMMEHGYAGAREIADGFAHLWGWEVMDPDTVSDFMWGEMYDVYVQDKYDMGLEGWFNENNPWALQAMTARMLEAIRKGYWDPSDEVKTALAETYQKSVEEYGVTCCGHTCGNPFINDYVSGILSAPIEAEPQGEEPSTQISRRGGGGGRRTEEEKGLANETAEVSGVSKVGEELKKPPEETGETAEKVKKGRVMKEEEPASALPISGAPLMGLIVVIAILVFVGVGFWLKRRK